VTGDRPWAGRRLHLLGIGGAGMSGYARVAVALGAQVSGSDSTEGPALGGLRALGVHVSVGHDAANVPAGDDVEVVYSTAVKPDNPERVAVRERGLSERPRAALLEQLSALRRTIAVGGTHGKTTTSSMVAHTLLECGLDPGYLIGGDLRTTGLNAAWGTGDVLVVEADESDRSMLSLHTAVAVVTNVEFDHAETYGSLEEVHDVFRAFLARAPQAVIWDRPEIRALRGEGPQVLYDVPAPELRDGGSSFDWRGHRVTLHVPGAHNALNAAAALEASVLAGAEEAQAVTALQSFRGAGRRFEALGKTASGARVIDDYAHHPTEVAATVAAGRTLEPRRLVAVFQPHLFSRTQLFASAFGAALAEADIACVLDIYPAREKAEDFPGVTGLMIAEAVADARKGADVRWLPRFDDAELVLRATLHDGDVCLVMGAGDVNILAKRLVRS
jgi:UDP-N-acetylmuramate--alanine ligase